METRGLEQRLSDLKARLQKLAPEDQERALDGFAQVLTLCEMRREGEEAQTLAITLAGPGGIANLNP
jgi:hypothetical protein